MEGRFVKLFNLGCAIGVGTVALLVMLSWLVEGSPYTPIDPAHVPMLFKTAMCFLLCATSLAMIELKWRRPATALAFAALLVGGLTLIERVGQLDLGTDRLFLAPPTYRMSVSSSLNFVLCGAALAVTANFPRMRTWLVLLVALIGSIVGAAGLVALIADATGIDVASGVTPIRMAVNSAICFLLLGTAIILLVKEHTAGRPLWLPIPVFIGLFAATVIIAQAIRAQQNIDFDKTIRSETRKVAHEIEQRLGMLYRSLDRIGQRWEAQGGTPRALWEADAAAHLRGFLFLDSLIWADADGRLQWIISQDNSRELDLYDLRSDPELASTLNWAVGVSSPRASPVTVREGGSAAGDFFYLRPLYVDGKGAGFIVVLVNIPRLFDVLATESVFDRVTVTVNEAGRQIFSSDRAAAGPAAFEERVLITNLGRPWTVIGRPGPRLSASIYTNVPVVVAGFGLLVASLMASSAYLAVKQEGDLRRLRVSQERLALAVSGTADGLWDWDLITGRIYRSPRFSSLLGYDRWEDFTPTAREFLSMIHPDDRDAAIAAVDAHLRDRTPCNVTFRFPHRDGHDVWLNMRGQAVWDAGGKPVRLTGFITDISESKEAERKMLAYAAELERSNRELDEFAYVASHDLKAPLRVINNASRWLEEDLGPHMSEGDRENMTLLRGRVQRMEKLLDDLLEYSRIGRSTDDRYNEIVNGQELMENILLLLSPPAGFEVRVAPGFADISVKRMPLQQALYNLIANAIKHHDKTEGIVEVSVADEGDHLRFTVRDDGPGIPPRFHAQVFKMFQTLKPRDQVEGSGMGLALVKKMVDHVGGELALDSEEGQGASFSFTWPKEPQIGAVAQVKAA